MTTWVQSAEHYWQVVNRAARQHLTPSFIERMRGASLSDALGGIMDGMVTEGFPLLHSQALADPLDAQLIPRLEDRLLRLLSHDEDGLIAFFCEYANDSTQLSSTLTNWVARWHALTLAVILLYEASPLLLKCIPAKS